jgi:hypothetical protein
MWKLDIRPLSDVSIPRSPVILQTDAAGYCAKRMAGRRFGVGAINLA